MSVKPTTRLGYNFGLRRQNASNEGDRRGSAGNTFPGRERPRMAGDINLLLAEADTPPNAKGSWLKPPNTLRLTQTISNPPGGDPVEDETDFF